MTNPLNIPPNEGEPKNSEDLLLKGCSKEASEIAQELILTFAGAIDGKELTAFELMQSLVEFFVSTVKTVEQLGTIPPNFRRFLLRNIELNFDYKDAKEQGIDLSDLLIMGLREELDGGEGDI